MSGKRITVQQVRLYMSSRKQGQTQEQASAKAGVSERSGRRIEDGRISVMENQERHWRTRKDPFAEVWDSEVVALLEKQPALDATTLFEDLQDRHRGKFGNGKKRTFQRRVKVWKALHGQDLRGHVPPSAGAGPAGVIGLHPAQGGRGDDRRRAA